MSLSYSWPRACGRISPSPHPRDLSLSLSPALSLSLALSSCPHPSASGWGVGLLVGPSLPPGWSPTPGSLPLVGGGARPAPLSASPSLSRSYLARGSPSPSVPLKSLGSQNLRPSPSLALCPPPHVTPSVSPEPSAPAPTGSRTLGDGAGPSPGGGGGGRGRPLTWPRPCRPPPHQPGFIKQTGPYIARPRGPGSPRPPYKARRLLAALGPALGGRGAALGSLRPHTRPPHQPPPPAARIPDPGSDSSSPRPRCTLGQATRSLSVPLCQMGPGLLPWQRSREHSSELGTSSSLPCRS